MSSIFYSTENESIISYFEFSSPLCSPFWPPLLTVKPKCANLMLARLNGAHMRLFTDGICYYSALIRTQMMEVNHDQFKIN